jgi:hypothetical protein
MKVALEAGAPTASHRIKIFPSQRTPLDWPKQDVGTFVKELYQGSNLSWGDSSAVGTLPVEEMILTLRGFYGEWKHIHDRKPYVVIEMPQAAADRAHCLKVLEKVKNRVEHIIFMELCTDADASIFEGRFLRYLSTRLEWERKRKTK